MYAQVNQRRDVEYLGRIILNADVTGELTIEQALALTAPILPESVLEVRQHLANIQRLSSQVQSQHDTVQRSLGTVGQHADQVSVWAQQTHTQADRALGHANLASEQSTLATQQATRAQTQASAASDSARLAQEAKVALDGAVDRFELKNNAATDSDIDQKAVFSKFVRLPQFWRAFRAFLSQRFDGASTDLAVSEKALSAGLDTKWTFTLAKTNRYGATVLSHDYDSDIQYKAVTPFALKSGLDWVRYTTGLALDGKQDKGVVVAHDHDERYLPKQGPAVAVAQNTDTSWKPADGGLRCNSTSAGTFAPNADYCDYLTWGHRGGAKYYHALFVSHAFPSRLQFATSRAAGQANWSTKSLAFTDEFYGRQASDNRYLLKAEKASDAQRLDGIDATGFGRAYSASLTTGAGDWTTAQFVTYLQGQGCFDSPYWFTKCSWSYANNKRITDLGSALGHIHLAGCVIEVLGSAAHYMIRVTTPSTTTGGAVANADYLYVDHGSGYAPGWRRGYNSRIKPTAAEVGAYSRSESDHRFLSAAANDSFSGDLVSTARNRGLFGVYDASKTDHIWSMGAAYRNSSTGADFGNLYGLVYKHTNNPTGGTMAGGHQAVWCDNGVPKAALGHDGVWGTHVYDGSGSARKRVYSPNNLRTALDDICPAWVPRPSPLSTVPSGYLECRGQTFDLNAYPSLASAYPSGQLPDLRAHVIKGWDNGRGVDAGRAILSSQGDAMRNLTGNIIGISESFGWSGSANGAFIKSSNAPNLGATPSNTDRNNCGTVNFNASRQVPIANEVRVKNIAFMYIVRAA